MGFKEITEKNWLSQPSNIWPIQKFHWKDLTATRGKSYYYEIVPMAGKPNSLEPLTDLTLRTNYVMLSPDCGANCFAYFNRGILSTQHLSYELPKVNGKPDYGVLRSKLEKKGDNIRQALAGQMIEALKSLLSRARSEGGKCYCSLYELNDPELIELLKGSSDFVHIILSNAGEGDGNDSINAEARQELKDVKVDLTDRMLSGSHIGHNKFVVYVDKNNKPTSVLTGSTNWTTTGLCGQSNNSLIVESPDLAAYYVDYWNRLKEDTDQANGEPNNLQGIKFRTENNHQINTIIKADNTTTNITCWFSPNTEQKTKPPHIDPTDTYSTSIRPYDMADVFKIMENANQAILFLVFNPGSPSILEKAIQCKQNNPKLYIKGAKTDVPAAKAEATITTDDNMSQPIITTTAMKTKFIDKSMGSDNYVSLYRESTTDKPEKVIEADAKVESDCNIILTRGVDDPFANYYKELLLMPGGHAIIHDKVVVVDPFSDDCAVITGSHNLGYKASYSNDENLLIIKGNKQLAASYSTNIVDIYDHYAWRYHLHLYGMKNKHQLLSSDTWQDSYLQIDSIQNKEMMFWIS